MNIKMDIILNSKRYYRNNPPRWIELQADDITPIMMKHNPSKLKIQMNGLSIRVEATMEVQSTKDLGKSISDDIQNIFQIRADAKVRECSYVSKEIGTLKKVITLEKVFKY